MQYGRSLNLIWLLITLFGIYYTKSVLNNLCNNLCSFKAKTQSKEINCFREYFILIKICNRFIDIDQNKKIFQFRKISHKNSKHGSIFQFSPWFTFWRWLHTIFRFILLIFNVIGLFPEWARMSLNCMWFNDSGNVREMPINF